MDSSSSTNPTYSLEIFEWTPTLCLFPDSSSESQQPYQSPATIQAKLDHLTDAVSLLNTSINTINDINNGLDPETQQIGGWRNILTGNPTDASSVTSAEERLSKLEAVMVQTQQKLQNLDGYLRVAERRMAGSISRHEVALESLNAPVSNSVSDLYKLEAGELSGGSIMQTPVPIIHRLKQRTEKKKVRFADQLELVASITQTFDTRIAYPSPAFEQFSTEKMLAGESIIFGDYNSESTILENSSNSQLLRIFELPLSTILEEEEECQTAENSMLLHFFDLLTSDSPITATSTVEECESPENSTLLHLFDVLESMDTLPQAHTPTIIATSSVEDEVNNEVFPLVDISLDDDEDKASENEWICVQRK